MNIYHHEAFVRLMDTQGRILPAGTFMPLVHRMDLDIALDEAVIEHALKHASSIAQSIAINLSSRIIQDADAIEKLMTLLEAHQGTLNFEISNQEILKHLDATLHFTTLLRQCHHQFGIDKFSATNTNLEYLQAIKPAYIKIDCHYLRDMLCQHAGVQNNALHILMDSLDTKIIATSVEEVEIKEALEEVGITHFQGSLLAKAKML
jgi:EAL domain-containing protein (putative c-di-GMP-specific phosphodiesterase class I)